jgi:hypothetical protein
VIALLCGCNTVDGGAVELSWKLRPSSSDGDKKFVDCTPPTPQREPDGGLPPHPNPITKMRLFWSVRMADGSEQSGTDEWSCNDSHGVTGFDLPPGQALLAVKPLCANDVEAFPGSYITPAAQERRVTKGDTVSLGAVQLVVIVDYCPDQPCICE